MRHADQRVSRIVVLFEGLTPADLPRLHGFYAEDARFKDPFNEVQGVAAIRAVFEHMYRALAEPHFVVHEAVAEGDQCFLPWDFRFHFRRGDTTLQTVRGCTQIRFDAQGRIILHRDWWDAAEELYEKLPLLGALMRFVKRRARH